jgi:hypothetical protein
MFEEHCRGGRARFEFALLHSARHMLNSDQFCTWCVQKVSNLWSAEIHLLIWRYKTLISFKVVSLVMHTLLPALPPLLETFLERVLWNGDQPGWYSLLMNDAAVTKMSGKADFFFCKALLSQRFHYSRLEGHLCWLTYVHEWENSFPEG